MRHLKTAVLMTVATTVLLGIIYPLVVTGIAHAFFRQQADGQLIKRDGEIIGSRIIGQPFTGPAYFHSRPSSAGQYGYDAADSGGAARHQRGFSGKREKRFQVRGALFRHPFRSLGRGPP